VTFYGIGSYNAGGVHHVYVTLPDGGEVDEVGDNALVNVLGALEHAKQGEEGFKKFDDDQKARLAHFINQMEEGSRAFFEFENDKLIRGYLQSELDPSFSETITEDDLKEIVSRTTRSLGIV